MLVLICDIAGWDIRVRRDWKCYSLKKSYYGWNPLTTVSVKAVFFTGRKWLVSLESKGAKSYKIGVDSYGCMGTFNYYFTWWFQLLITQVEGMGLFFEE